jgi:tetratricopeptide (TPR) repeat protein
MAHVPVVFRSGSRALLALVLALPLAAGEAVAQHDDDDILAPVGGAKPVDAAPLPKVGLVPLVPIGDTPRPLAEQVTQGMSKELSESFQIISLAIGGGGAKGKGAMNPFLGQDARKQADKLVASGASLLEQLQFGRAQKAYEKALESYAAGAATIDDVRPVLEAHLGLAEVYARQGQENLAKRHLSDVVRLNPEHELDASRFPPLFIATHQKVRAAVLQEAKAAVVVDRTATGARVTIDGREVGEAPVRVTGLPPGKHFVRVFGEGAGLFGAVVEVVPGGEQSVSPGFMALNAEGPTDILAQNRFSDAAAAQVAASARDAGIDVVLVGAASKTNIAVPTTVIVIDAKTGGVARVGPLNFDGDLLNVSIESLRVSEKIASLRKKGGFGKDSGEPLIAGAKGAASIEMNEVGMRYDVKAPPAEARRARAIGADEPAPKTAGRLEGGGQGDSGRVVGGGDTRARKSLRDDQETGRFGATTRRRSEYVPDEDVPLLAQPWFWPTAIAGGVVGTILLTGGALGGLVAAGAVPDPRDRAGMSVTVEVP